MCLEDTEFDIRYQAENQMAQADRRLSDTIHRGRHRNNVFVEASRVPNVKSAQNNL